MPRARFVESLLLVCCTCVSVGFFAATPAPATEIAGKWGIGVGTGSLIGSRPEASIIRGTSARTAWILDMSINQNSQDTSDRYVYELLDTLVTREQDGDFWQINGGPRLRRFLRPAEAFSPYIDIFGRLVYDVAVSSRPDRSTRDQRIGGEIGVAFGAEYFFSKWPVSLAAHTTLGSVNYRHRVIKINDLGAALESVDDNGWTRIGLEPGLQARVYF